MKAIITLSSFKNRGKNTKYKILVVISIVVSYGLISTFILSRSVYNNNNNNDVNHYKNFFIRYLTSIFSKRNLYNLKKNDKIISKDPINAVLYSALENNIYQNERELYYKSFNDELAIGILSNQNISFYNEIQNEIDNYDNNIRCKRYGGYYNNTNPQNRKIYYGALAANEPWEVFEIVAAEVYGLYEGMVFVEGNRTQNFTPRKFQRLHHNITFQKLFGTNNVQVRAYINEDSKLLDLTREHQQRAEILIGWKELGMQSNDVGLLADSDETFTRDFLKAVQVCDGIEILDYDKHFCHHSKVKLVATTRVYEGSPECIASNRQWFHPDLIIGHCIEGITDKPEQHKPVPRTSEKYAFLRAKGYGNECGDWALEDELPNNTYHSWNAADFRRGCGGYMVGVRDKERKDVLGDGKDIDSYTGYHFHNFFSQIKSTRFKYSTYGHPDPNIASKTIEHMSNDLKMMYKCVMELEDSKDQKWLHTEDGYNNTKGFYPIYFQDSDYRERRHKALVDMVDEDDKLMKEKLMKEQISNTATDVDNTNSNKTKVLENGTTKSVAERRKMTDAGIDVSDPSLFVGGESIGDSSSATVIALATGYDITIYQRFVGALRKTGYKGHIILGISPDADAQVLQYLKYRNVIVKQLQWINCTYSKSPNEKNDIFKKTKCSDPYPDIKIRWSRFPLARDWLLECKTCTGPVLLMDARDSLFQLDPFGPGSPKVEGLQIFQEHANMTTANWLTNWPIKTCKGVEYEEPMLCSGTTVGTRVAMIKYLEVMYEEMKVWIEDPNCRFDINGDDQSIHNYLFYSGQLPFASSIPNRHGGIINTIGFHASQLVKEKAAKLKKKGIDKEKARRVPFDGANKTLWIGLQFDVTNENGLFTEFDGSISRVVHQCDRFDIPFYEWIKKQTWANDNDVNLYALSIVDETRGEQLKSALAAQKKKTIRNTERRTVTDTGIDLTDPELYKSIDLKGDSTTATVMALATGYEIETYQRFVGGLRKAGYKGHIILGVAPDVTQEILKYFEFRNVTPKILKWVNCTYAKGPEDKNDIFKKTTCSDPYPDIKIRWSRFPLARDWLRDCETCTGPVLIMDARDALFQLDPFGPGSPVVTGLQVFEEHVSMTTTDWLTDIPFSKCKGVHYDETMLCSGTTVGTRAAMLKYLEIMYEEMKIWIEDPKCRFDFNGDDQSIHNFLFYSGQLPFASSVVNRMGGIVNTIGHHAAQVAKIHFMKLLESENLPKWEAAKRPYDGANEKTWIGEEFGLTNEIGQFIEFDGSLSRVVHQYDRFHRPFDDWIKKQAFIRDPIPLGWKSTKFQ